ncbi:MAG: HI0074 family nucleotidyltransferase substrate-binding subunit [Clostridia bacterium]|nr:HI0074 family nucleotidyltransferase substrate-binding subunit [Clostridia bacterium]
MQKFDNFCRALENLGEIGRYSAPYGTVELTGMVALFEICFEQAWKAMKEALELSGFSEGKTGSPKLILKTAYAAGMIGNEDLWLSALEARNSAAHAYNAAVAEDIVQKTKAEFLPMFRALKEEIARNWAV